MYNEKFLLSILFLAKKAEKKYYTFMSKENAKKELYLISLFFEPNNGSEQLSFPLICKFIRETFNVSQSAMAERLNVRLSTYQQWEYAKREPSSKIAVNLFFMYLQALYIRKQTPRATEFKHLLDSLLKENPKELSPNETIKLPEAICA